MDIYAATEQPLDNINSEAIVGEIKKYNKNVVLINSEDELSNYLDKIIENKNILLTMGAGNISKFVNYYKKHLIQ
jgi:UDP-N-acetylmuramate--alanine ligase